MSRPWLLQYQTANTVRLHIWHSGAEITVIAAPNVSGRHIYSLAVNHVIDKIVIDNNSGEVGTEARLHSVTFIGSGASPFGANNC